MSFEHSIRSGSRQLRCGYTTGTCAALAASGAAELLLGGVLPESMGLLTPKGWRVETELLDGACDGEIARCAVKKDAGDDPDVTDGMLVYASVTKTRRGISIDGGEGVGRVTKPGLDQPVGAAAINSVPRRMITAAVEAVCAAHSYAGGLAITISIPGGEERAKQTFNPQLGIEGGLSVLGTSGIVEPMSEQALLDTIALAVRQAAASGADRLLLTPGNYGADYLKDRLPELEPLPADGGVARLYRLPDSMGNIGLISPVSAHFCADCNRIRITADGKIKPCLHSSDELSIKGQDYDGMLETIRSAILAKPRWHGELSYSERSHANRNMNQIGG